MSEDNLVKEFKIYGMAIDPIYIGTGGYTIGRVDNTIVRDPITKLPKIPGSSLAGTWRYYVTLELQNMFKNEFRISKEKRRNVELLNLLKVKDDKYIKIIDEIIKVSIEKLEINKDYEIFLKQFLLNFIPSLLFDLINVYEKDYLNFESTENSRIREESFKAHLFCKIDKFIKKYDFISADIKTDTELDKEDINNGVRPDIVIHKRGTHYYNLVIIEIKRNTGNNTTQLKNSIKKDLEKLSNFKKGHYKYALPLFIGIDITEEMLNEIIKEKNYSEILILLINTKNSSCNINVYFNKIKEIFQKSDLIPMWVLFEGNRYAGIRCAGQDELPNITLEESKEKETGHCGYCIVCKGFGFSKKDISWQGMIYFSDLNILFFPVFTRLGTKWITTEEILKNAGLYKGEIKPDKKENDDLICFTLKKEEKNEEEGHINLGWLYLPYKVENKPIDLSKINGFGLNPEDIIIVPKELFSQIVNSNLEVRTSVSIDPITGAAKEGALFTSEAIPRGTIFHGDLRINDKSAFKGLLDKIGDLPDYNMLKEALCDSKHFFETLGIGGMTTRGFGRLKLEMKDGDKNCEDDLTQLNNVKTDSNGGEGDDSK
jgi:CRISPR-associated protein Cmr4